MKQLPVLLFSFFLPAALAALSYILGNVYGLIASALLALILVCTLPLLRHRENLYFFLLSFFPLFLLNLHFLNALGIFSWGFLDLFLKIQLTFIMTGIEEVILAVPMRLTHPKQYAFPLPE